MLSAIDKFGIHSEMDSKYLLRMYGNGDLGKYSQRLERLGFVDCDDVLDAGCGYGQWSLALAELNLRVTSVDVDKSRSEVTSYIAEQNGLGNINSTCASMESLPFSNNAFDAVFCYAALPLTRYLQTLREFMRVLRPGGKLYFGAYDIGHMLYNIVSPHNPTSDFNPRKWAAKAIIDTDTYLESSIFAPSSPRDSLYIPIDTVLDFMAKAGYKNIQWDCDGKLSISGKSPGDSFASGEFLGFPGVYEVLCTSRDFN